MAAVLVFMATAKTAVAVSVGIFVRVQGRTGGVHPTPKTRKNFLKHFLWIMKQILNKEGDHSLDGLILEGESRQERG